MNRNRQLSDPSRFSGMAAGFFMATLGAVLFSGKAIVVKFTYRYGIDAVTLIAFRMLFAMPFFAAVAPEGKVRMAAGRLGNFGSGIGVTLLCEPAWGPV